MDAWTAVKIVWGGIGLGVAGLVLIAAWRARGLIGWNRSIRKELKALAREAEQAPPPRQRAIGLIVGTCGEISRSLSPGQLVDGERLGIFVRSIAACFFPQSERPELQITLGHLIKSLDASMSRFDRIVQRPGLKRINAVNVRNLNDLYRWSTALIARPWVKWYLTHQKKIRSFFLIRLVIIPDPFSWVLFLSRKLLVLVLMKTLLLDITLFAGRLALDAFDRASASPAEENETSLEETLDALSHADTAPIMEYDPDIAAIRRELIGFTSMVLSNPTFQDWKTAVRKAAGVLARRHFPHAERPLEEAAVGPLLERTRSLLNTLVHGADISVVRYVYQTRLDTLVQARDIGGLVLTPTVRGILRTTLSTYGWIKWPLKIYRRIKRFSLPGIAADVGWLLGKKSALMLIHGRTFDLACRELDRVYRASAALTGTAGDPPPALPAPEADDGPEDGPPPAHRSAEAGD